MTVPNNYLIGVSAEANEFNRAFAMVIDSSETENDPFLEQKTITFHLRNGQKVVYSFPYSRIETAFAPPVNSTCY